MPEGSGGLAERAEWVAEQFEPWDDADPALIARTVEEYPDVLRISAQWLAALTIDSAEYFDLDGTPDCIEALLCEETGNDAYTDQWWFATMDVANIERDGVEAVYFGNLPVRIRYNESGQPYKAQARLNGWYGLYAIRLRRRDDVIDE